MKLNELFASENLSEAPKYKYRYVYDRSGKDKPRDQQPPAKPTSLLGKIKSAIDPTAEGRKRLAAKTNALNQEWLNYRGETQAIPNSANIEHWVKNDLRLDDPQIWSQAIEEFSEENPKAGKLYKDNERLSPGDISKFLNKIVQIRLMNQETPLRPANVQYNDPRWTQFQASGSKSIADFENSMNHNAINYKWGMGQRDDKNSKNKNMPQHPIKSNMAFHSNPQTAQAAPAPQAKQAAQPPINPATPDDKAATQANNPGINPEPVNPNEPAMLKPDDKNAVDWQKIRDRFPQKRRVSVPMTAVKVPDEENKS